MFIKTFRVEYISHILCFWDFFLSFNAGVVSTFLLQNQQDENKFTVYFITNRRQQP